MSSLWTPGGEVPVSRESESASQDAPASPTAQSNSTGQSNSTAQSNSTGREQPSPEELDAQLDDLRQRLAATPAEVVVANHAFGLFELAALHLSLEPPQLDQARLAIDALNCLVEGLGERLGDSAAQLSDGLAQLRLAYVQIHAARSGASQAAPPPPPA
jgi:hypothetical protein